MILKTVDLKIASGTLTNVVPLKTRRRPRLSQFGPTVKKINLNWSGLRCRSLRTSPVSSTELPLLET